MLYDMDENNRFLFNMSFNSLRMSKKKKNAVTKRTGFVP